MGSMRQKLQITKRFCPRRNNHTKEHKKQMFVTRLYIASAAIMEYSKIMKIKLCSTEKEIIEY